MPYALGRHVILNMAPFRLHAQSVFLTYPQCSLEPEELLRHLQSAHNVDTYVISQEKHGDGNLHLHAYIRLVQKMNTTNQRVFDVCGFHPNIQSARNTNSVIKYIKKHGNYISNLSDADGGSGEKRSWKQIMEESENQEEFLKNVKDIYPRDFCLHLNRLKETAAHLWPEKVEQYQNQYTQWKIPTELSEWVTENIGAASTNGKVLRGTVWPTKAGRA